ncbi:MAG: hypothetical protein A2X22_04035 [Bacteroidetes bacterium GWF2_49_14]|nr:MAG: hypothetical protein A2X22_04035 [Bacteroidetes bacterium GWF2_49_14]HBB91686.1 hypothetical protein [Bacteroidales bacterium]
MMVKKITNGLLVFILLLTTTGVTFHYHYCGNTLMAFSVFHTPKPCCEHPEDCCHDNATTFQLKNDFLSSANQVDFSVTSLDLPMVATCRVETIQAVDEIIRQKFPEESPPPTVSQRLSKLQQYLI